MTHRLEKRDDSLEKKEVRDEGPSPDESAPAMPPTPAAAPPYVAAWFRGRFWPLWNVERLWTLRGNGPVVKRFVMLDDPPAPPTGVAAPEAPPTEVAVPPTVRPALQARKITAETFQLATTTNFL